ncbi:MAG TPA: hypothetical protein VHZ55_35160 [Bryobacteraceae bacterium]|jgi:hypothetical protein|nr:hypothetical protein [Bryobacteraceae bacterium]
MLLAKGPAITISLLCLILPGVPASATSVSYSTYASWSAAVTNPIELNYSAVNGAGGNYSTAAGKTLTPMSGPSLPFIFTGPEAGGYQLTGGDFTTRNLVSLYGPANGAGNITVTLPTGGENAFLLGLGATNNATSMTIALSDGETFTVAPAANTTSFLGVSISHDVAWITITTPTQPLVDDFFFAGSKLSQDTASPGNAPVAVEGSTFSLIGGGLLSLLGIRRKLTSRKSSEAM